MNNSVHTTNYDATVSLSQTMKIAMTCTNLVKIFQTDFEKDKKLTANQIFGSIFVTVGKCGQYHCCHHGNILD